MKMDFTVSSGACRGACRCHSKPVSGEQRSIDSYRWTVAYVRGEVFGNVIGSSRFTNTCLEEVFIFSKSSIGKIAPLASLLVSTSQFKVCQERRIGKLMFHMNGGSKLDVLKKLEKKNSSSKPIGILSTMAGIPVDVRDTTTLNNDALVSNEYFLDDVMHTVAERIPERVVHAKGTGAFGYFEVTHDVSEYTKADVFNGVGKKTPVAVRFSTALGNKGGNDIAREIKGFTIKFYTNEGNLDFLGLNVPVYLYSDPNIFTQFVHAFRRNPRTNLFDNTSRWDLIILRPILLNALFWLFSDYGSPNGYRKMDGFPLHTYELNNKHGDRYYAKFSFRTEQGLENLTTAEAATISGQDLDYATRDLYNNIALKNYPSWRIEMDVMTSHDITNVDFNPFDVTKLWKNGTYHTVQIGRLVLDRNPDNFFEAVELSAYNPGSLVPGINSPPDTMFKSRRLFYRDAQNYRLGINHNRINVNVPKYLKTYNRDGVAPVDDNMKDAPNYYPNSFNGPVPVVNEARPKARMIVFESNAVDLEPTSNFYKYILNDEGKKQRFIDNIVLSLVNVVPEIREKALKLLTLVDLELGIRVRAGVTAARARVRDESLVTIHH
ncbi:catalase-like [Galleria mellonella]|uniref:Catalase-like n=1 Tax=Galleria mellonella TaxID=7137 RepID=A0ABM3N1M2_GALME|nr:catalase-like [Galleria mellonella]